MYTDTTSFYSGTVVDQLTYCRGDDDIIVVEFDGDEDELGVVPGRHIPARFCTMICNDDPLSKVRRRGAKGGEGGGIKRKK